MRPRRACLILCLASSFLSSRAADAIGISITGNWILSITSSDLVAGAGSDLAGSYQSSSGQVAVDVIGTSGSSDAWRIDVRRSDTTWHESLVVSVKRTSNGSGSGTISGGTAFQSIGPTDATFFSGSGDRSAIDLQLQLSGLSVQVPPSTYSTTVIYTVIDI